MLMKLVFASVLLVTANSKAEFKCPHDGYLSDKDDCSIFFQCANSQAHKFSCPPGLLYSAQKEQCDWAELVHCEYTAPPAPEQKDVKVPNGPLIYLTFDDGPNLGTPHVLDALKNQGVRATFFINSKNVEETFRTPEEIEERKKNLIRMHTEGHLIADHSYDHMLHNNLKDTPVNAYLDATEDATWFGPRNILPTLAVYKEAGFDASVLNHIRSSMSSIIRMPYSNFWRVKTGAGNITADCPHCTNNGKIAGELADLLSDGGADVYGWDLEWRMNYAIPTGARPTHGGETMLNRLKPEGGKLQSKLVVLTHDIAYRPGGDMNGQAELELFLRLAKDKGFRFRTMDTYITDA